MLTINNLRVGELTKKQLGRAWRARRGTKKGWTGQNRRSLTSFFLPQPHAHDKRGNSMHQAVNSDLGE